jgi:hypothetical protein
LAASAGFPIWRRLIVAHGWIPGYDTKRHDGASDGGLSLPHDI